MQNYWGKRFPFTSKARAVSYSSSFLYSVQALGGPKNDFSSGKKRVIGYKKALEEVGIGVKNSYIVQGDFSYACSLPKCGLHRLLQKVVLQSASLPEFPKASVLFRFLPVIHREQLCSLLLQRRY